MTDRNRQTSPMSHGRVARLSHVVFLCPPFRGGLGEIKKDTPSLGAKAPAAVFHIISLP